MKLAEENPEDAQVVRNGAADPESTSAVRSSDQRFFNESLRAGVRSLGELVRERKQGKEQG